MKRLIPFILIGSVIGLFFGYINPTYTGKITELRTQIDDYDRALVAADEFKKKEAQLVNERNALSSDSLTRLQAFLPDGVDNVQLILDLNSLASRSGIQLSNFDISENAAPAAAGDSGALALTDGKRTDSLDLSVTATGNYGAFRTFLAGVEQSLRPLDLVEMNLSDSATGVYTYAITFRIYWLH